MSSCSCGSDCKCGSNCGCDKYSFSFSENTATETIISGVAASKTFYETSEMGVGAENGCKCGSNCSCDPCNCK